MSDEIPQWALDEVDKRVPYPTSAPSNPTAATVAWQWQAYAGHIHRLAASLIAQHEEPPVDPLLIEARELVAKYHDQAGRYASAVNTREGKWDHTSMVQETHEALRHVLELGKAGAA